MTAGNGAPILAQIRTPTRFTDRKTMQHFRIPFIVALLLFTAILASAQTDRISLPEGWLSFTPDGGSFSLALPAEPTGSEETMSEVSQNMKAAYYTSMGNDLLVVVGDLYNLPRPPEQFSEAERRSIYTNFRDGLTRGLIASLAAKGLKLNTTYGDQKNVTVDRLEGFEQAMTVGRYKGRARLLVASDRIYIFCAVAFSDSAGRQIDASLNSFQEIGRRRYTPAALRDVAVLSERPF